MGHSSFSEGLCSLMCELVRFGKEPSAGGDEGGLEKFGSCAVLSHQDKKCKFPSNRKLFFWWANSGALSSQRRCPKSGLHGAVKNYVEFWKEREEQVFWWSKRPPSRHSFPSSPFLPFEISLLVTPANDLVLCCGLCLHTESSILFRHFDVFLALFCMSLIYKRKE